jgi:predicted RNA polymerase sigma factor
MFALCHPGIPVESQIGLSLSILCGFGANEIADAFLTDREVIYKRLNRAKEKLRTENIKVEMPSGTEIDKRLETVLTTLYLLFSEGYYSASNNTSLRKELCLEAMRLNRMLIDHEQTDTPAVNALLSLMCFHASRFEARTSHNGEFVIYEEQDEALWNEELKERGVHYLNRASTGKKVTRYHIEAAIAYWHTQKKETQEKWESILQLYNRLLQFEYSPVAALNRTYALSKANGKEEAIIEAEKLNLNGNRLYHCLLANLYEQVDDEKAIGHWKTALSLTKTISDRSFIQQKIDALTGNV